MKSDTKARCGVLCASQSGAFQNAETQTISASAKRNIKRRSSCRRNKRIKPSWAVGSPTFGARPAISPLLTRLRRRHKSGRQGRHGHSAGATLVLKKRHHRGMKSVGSVLHNVDPSGFQFRADFIPTGAISPGGVNQNRSDIGFLTRVSFSLPSPRCRGSGRFSRLVDGRKRLPEEFLDGGSNLSAVRLESKMPGVKELHLCIRIVSFE
jgi:hypothetical protein